MKNVFLAISGETPAIITEGVWCLAVERNIKLDEIHVVTTTVGHEALDDSGFFNGTDGPMHRMSIAWKDFAGNIPKFDEGLVHIPIGMVRGDAVDTTENTCMEGEITHWIRQFTKNNDTRLYALMSGGRKTMAAYMSLGMLVHSRPADLLFHVLDHIPRGVDRKSWLYPRNEDERGWVNLFEVPYPHLRSVFVRDYPQLLEGSLTQAARGWDEKNPIVDGDE